jgi:hypothetical protein
MHLSVWWNPALFYPFFFLLVKKTCSHKIRGTESFLLYNTTQFFWNSLNVMCQSHTVMVKTYFNDLSISWQLQDVLIQFYWKEIIGNHLTCKNTCDPIFKVTHFLTPLERFFFFLFFFFFGGTEVWTQSLTFATWTTLPAHFLRTDSSFSVGLCLDPWEIYIPWQCTWHSLGSNEPLFPSPWLLILSFSSYWGWGEEAETEAPSALIWVSQLKGINRSPFYNQRSSTEQSSNPWNPTWVPILAMTFISPWLWADSQS